MVFAVGPLLAFLFVRRRSDPVHPMTTGAAIGAASGAWGALAIEFHCSMTYLAHVVVGHILPVVALAALGAWFGRGAVAIFARAK
jgi:hypothetical protein